MIHAAYEEVLLHDGLLSEEGLHRFQKLAAIALDHAVQVETDLAMAADRHRALEEEIQSLTGGWARSGIGDPREEGAGGYAYSLTGCRHRMPALRTSGRVVHSRW